MAITIVTFLISRLAPGDPAELKAGMGGADQSADKQITEEMVNMIRKQWHLDEPITTQFGIWLADVATFNFGRSFKDNAPVMDKIVERIPLTLSMNLVSLIIAYIIAIPIGIYSASHPGTFLDRFSTTTMFMLYSLPTFWIATLGIIFLTSPEYLPIFPPSGLYSNEYSESWGFLDKLADIGWHLALPMLIYTYTSFAYISRQMRGSMLEVIRQDYIRTARAKGLDERAVIYKHALRNSLIPIVTLLAGLLPGLIGGSVVVESIFTIPGMGLLGYQAVLERDYPIVMAILTISAILTMLGVLAADLMYSIIDPRIAFTKKSA
ncbi:MAG: ABC transporter permease [bacterium]|nr:ABC transporter permease [Candidatus Kapabacteria bacterium]